MTVVFARCAAEGIHCNPLQGCIVFVQSERERLRRSGVFEFSKFPSSRNANVEFCIASHRLGERRHGRFRLALSEGAASHHPDIRLMIIHRAQKGRLGTGRAKRSECANKLYPHRGAGFLRQSLAEFCHLALLILVGHSACLARQCPEVRHPAMIGRGEFLIRFPFLREPRIEAGQFRNGAIRAAGQD